MIPTNILIPSNSQKTVQKNNVFFRSNNFPSKLISFSAYARIFHSMKSSWTGRKKFRSNNHKKLYMWIFCTHAMCKWNKVFMHNSSFQTKLVSERKKIYVLLVALIMEMHQPWLDGCLLGEHLRRFHMNKKTFNMFLCSRNSSN